MGIFSRIFKENKKEEVPLSSLTIDKELSKLAIEVIGTSKDTALISLKPNDMSEEYARLCGLGLGNSFSCCRSNNISILSFWGINIYYVGKRI